jgi:hypothetical protein
MPNKSTRKIAFLAVLEDRLMHGSARNRSNVPSLKTLIREKKAQLRQQQQQQRSLKIKETSNTSPSAVPGNHPFSTFRRIQATIATMNQHVENAYVSHFSTNCENYDNVNRDYDGDDDNRLTRNPYHIPKYQLNDTVESQTKCGQNPYHMPQYNTRQ